MEAGEAGAGAGAGVGRGMEVSAATVKRDMERDNLSWKARDAAERGRVSGALFPRYPPSPLPCLCSSAPFPLVAAAILIPSLDAGRACCSTRPFGRTDSLTGVRAQVEAGLDMLRREVEPFSRPPPPLPCPSPQGPLPSQGLPRAPPRQRGKAARACAPAPMP